MWEYVGIALALFGLVFGYIQIRRFQKIFKEYEPLIKRAMSIMGNLGKKTEVDNRLAGEVEGALKGGVMELIQRKYPEVAIVIGYLQEEHPELYDKIVENPDVLIGLYEKYAPLVQKLIGQQQNTVEYEY